LDIQRIDYSLISLQLKELLLRQQIVRPPSGNNPMVGATVAVAVAVAQAMAK